MGPFVGGALAGVFYMLLHMPLLCKDHHDDDHHDEEN
jgi:hypothetical protein